ncbi:MAG: hypothetical protein QXQ57_01155 [Sulfolobales archaeon]
MIDILSFFNEYMFRRLAKTELRDIGRDLCELGFKKIIAISFKSIFYRNVYEANREVRDEYRKIVEKIRCPNILIAYGGNPDYIGTPRDLLDRGLERIVVLAPAYQGFRLDRERTIRFINNLIDYDSRIIIIDLLEDYREFHRGYRFRYLIKYEHLENFLKRVDRTVSRNLVLASFRYDLIQRVFREISVKEVLVDISNDTFYGPQYDRVKELVNNVGEDLVVLGTRYPIANPLASIFRVLFSDISERSKEKILYRNAERFLQGISLV